MQKRAINKVLVIGRGEIYDDINKGDQEEIQSCLAILEEECQPVLLTNASSDTLMDSVLDIPIYQLPLSSSFINKVVTQEHPDAVFAPFVESSGWRLVQRLSREGYWQQRGMAVIGDSLLKGKSLDANREIRKAIAAASLRQCQQVEITSLKQAEDIPQTVGGFPLAVRSGDTGHTVIENVDSFRSKISLLLAESSNNKVVIEEYFSGWKQVKVGILKDNDGDVSVIYTSEQIAPIGYSKNSASVSPIQTLYKNQVQFVIGAAIQLGKALQDFAGYCTINFAIDPDTQKILVSEVDFSTDQTADVSLVSGCSLVKLSTKLLLGCSLYDLGVHSKAMQNRDSARSVLFKIPQFEFVGWPDAADGPGAPTKYKGDNIYVGQNFCEAFRKALYSESDISSTDSSGKTKLFSLRNDLLQPSWYEMLNIYQAFSRGKSRSEVKKTTGIDAWFLQHILLLVEAEQQLYFETLSSISKEQWENLKLFGFSDAHIARVLNQGTDKGEAVSESMVRSQREFFNTHPSALSFDTLRSSKFFKPHKKIMLLTSSVHDNGNTLLQIPAFILAKEARQMGFDVVIVGSDTSSIPFWMMFADYLYVEKLNWEIIYEIYQKEQPSGMFIESGDGLTELEKKFAGVGAPIIKVPVELTSRMRTSA